MIIMLVYFYLFVFQYFNFNNPILFYCFHPQIYNFFNPHRHPKAIPPLPAQSVWRSLFHNHFPMAAFVRTDSTNDSRRFHFFDMIKHSIFCDIT